MKRPRFLLAFYGDDLTGSTDALERLVLGGVRAALFLEVPSERDLREYPRLQAFGVAGMTRAMRTGALGRTLRPAFKALRSLRPRHVHYKVCSTFDSSPKLGSIGAAIDAGAEIFGGDFVPILGGAPGLGRYCAFGNLFARMGIGSKGRIYRLDRHPSMRRHPATPATESDLRIALGRQTKRTIALFDFLQLSRPRGESLRRFGELLAERPGAVLFDALTDAHVRRVGEILQSRAGGGHPLFSVGPSSVEAALAAARRPAAPAAAERSPGPLLVGSGSGSVVTRRQIAWAIRNGFRAIERGPRAVPEAIAELRLGRSVIIHAGRSHPGPRFGAELGEFLRRILTFVRPGRVVVAGGDSSSQAARSLGIRSLEMAARLTPGAPLCRARAPGSPAEGCDFVFKGGQVGAEDYFGAVAAGRRA